MPLNKYFRFIVFIFPAFLILSSCEKDPGTGGNSKIFGKIYVKDYNSTFTVLEDEYYAQAEDVYIVYGGNMGTDDRLRTSYDGSYEFKYLRKGVYHIFAYSKDSTLQTNALIPVIRDVEITKNNQGIEVPLITIYK